MAGESLTAAEGGVAGESLTVPPSRGGARCPKTHPCQVGRGTRRKASPTDPGQRRPREHRSRIGEDWKGPKEKRRPRSGSGMGQRPSKRPDIALGGTWRPDVALGWTWGRAVDLRRTWGRAVDLRRTWGRAVAFLAARRLYHDLYAAPCWNSVAARCSRDVSVAAQRSPDDSVAARRSRDGFVAALRSRDGSVAAAALVTGLTGLVLRRMRTEQFRRSSSMDLLIVVMRSTNWIICVEMVCSTGIKGDEIDSNQAHVTKRAIWGFGSDCVAEEHCSVWLRNIADVSSDTLSAFHSYTLSVRNGVSPIGRVMEVLQQAFRAPLSIASFLHNRY
ncbi:hypothetical protein C0J50_5945 [Silurus asotus]|uniref:Uncharacterized protein n=1 Tax=Silurus asotus TaxID=30991 RepID=A0AAD5A517_SILAS|nr:hypothetical protein C0J50_5945 [Silurus asotus]